MDTRFKASYKIFRPSPSIGLCACVLLLICFGCRLGPKYHPPAPEAPDEWKGAVTSLESTPYFEFWWEVFQDEALNDLEQMAVENNPDIYVALERVVEARANAGLNRSDLFLQLSLNPAYNDSGQLFQFFLPPGIALPTVDQVSPFFRIHQFLYAIPLNLSYELDLFGKVRGTYESARLRAEATLQDYYTILLSLTTELTSHYFQLRTLDAQLDALQLTVGTYRKNLQLVTARFDKGLVNYVDVTRASLQLSNAEGNFEDILRQRGIEENAIARLAGTLPSEFSIEHHPLIGVPPQIPTGVPASILAKRPDIAEAERNMKAEHKMIGVAYASFLPSITLTGALGYTSPDFGQFLKWISRYWSFGATANEPILDGGRNCANLAAAYARFKQASGAYKGTVLTAFQEVENALNNIERQDKQLKFLESSLSSSAKTYALSSKRYEKGIANYFEVVDSERDKLNAELNVIALQGARFVSTVQLIKAIGGSWDMCN